MSLIKPYPITPQRPVPLAIPRPEYVGRPAPSPYDGSHVQSEEVIEKMRIAGRIAAQALQVAGAAIAPGVTTDHIDAIAHEFMLDHGAYPSTLGYRGFPKSICTSINEVICHGIPDLRPLEDGDLVKVDITAYKNGVHGDNCATFFCGDVPPEARLLAERTKEALDRAIKVVQPGRNTSVIGRVIDRYAKRFGYGNVRDFTGHGVHSSFHSGLTILHYESEWLSTEIQVGMTFTIEPMLTLGASTHEMWDDGWTAATTDHSWVAQFEHSLVVTPDGAEILTLP